VTQGQWKELMGTTAAQQRGKVVVPAIVAVDDLRYVALRQIR
jgi:hypothetical protein